MAAAFLPHDKLEAWLTELAAGREVLVPVSERGAVVFRPFAPGAALVLARQAAMPPKASLFPASETLMRFTYRKDPEDLAKVSVDLEETVQAPPRLVFGGRPCDARGFRIFDRVYDTPAVRDPYYAARRANTIFVTLACDAPENACFCHWVGSSPSDSEGSDVLLTPVEGGYLVESVTERGGELLESGLLEDGSVRLEEAGAVRRAAREALEAATPHWDPAQAPAKLLEKFEDMAFWEEVSAKCISCGACTYLCPTCYCFNVTDERKGMKGERVRTWDNCMSYQFTLEASGHNPRPTKAHRLKNRVGHKFSYYPDIHGGVFACCGCGRCIKLCPVSVDIRELVRLSVERESAATGKK